MSNRRKPKGRYRKAASRSRRRRDDFRATPQHPAPLAEGDDTRSAWRALPDPYTLNDVRKLRLAAERELPLLRRRIAALVKMEQGIGELRLSEREIDALEREIAAPALADPVPGQPDT